MNEQGESPDGRSIEIPSGPTPLTLQAKIGRYFNIALLAAGQEACECSACGFLRSISELTIQLAAEELAPPPPPAARPPPPAAPPVESVPDARESPNT